MTRTNCYLASVLSLALSSTAAADPFPSKDDGVVFFQETSNPGEKVENLGPSGKQNSAPVAWKEPKFKVVLQITRQSFATEYVTKVEGDREVQVPVQKALSTSTSPVTLECDQLTLDLKVDDKGQATYQILVTGPVRLVLSDTQVRASEASYQNGKMQLKNVESIAGDMKMRSTDLEIEMNVVGATFGKKEPPFDLNESPSATPGAGLNTLPQARPASSARDNLIPSR